MIVGHTCSVKVFVPEQALSVSLAERVTLTPAPLLVVGVPLMTPLTELSESPAGSVPLETDHVYTPEPPVAATVCEYDVPTDPEGSEVVEMVMTGQPIAKVMDCVPWQPLASVARMVTLLLLCAVGVPLTTPVLLLRDRPEGSVPLTTAYV